MLALRLKSQKLISTTARHRYLLQDSRTDAGKGTHELEDGTKIQVDINGRVTSVSHATQAKLNVIETSPIQRRMAEPKKHILTAEEEREEWKRDREDEQIKKGERPARANHIKRPRHLPPGC